MDLEFKFDELKYDIVKRIDKELTDSQNAREFVSQKYDELCNKIKHLTELDATVTGFRSDVKTIEKQLTELSNRIDKIEKKMISRDSSITASNLF
ncbi:unnamed protein product [Parnassius apollo]|uniref:(apollo) hypothetical protein n=1 Tax=Parnassius apollo TaxID=110799 RepID=A0A8S3WNG0_PARAO|nr:unnamed protein product [Parnassius apollo]